MSTDQSASQLVHFLYHEFKTPLHIFKSIIQLLQNGSSPDQATLSELSDICTHYNSLLTLVLESPEKNWTIDELEQLKRDMSDNTQ